MTYFIHLGRYIDTMDYKYKTNIIINEKTYDKSVKRAGKKVKELEVKNYVSSMEDDPFLPDIKLWDAQNKSDSFFRQAKRIRHLDYKGIKTIYGTDFTDALPKLAKDPVFREKNGIGVETARRLINFNFTREHIPLIKNGVVDRKQVIKDFPALSSKGKLLSPSMNASNIFKLLRRLIGFDNVPSKCTCCGYNFSPPAMRFKRDLEEIFQDLQIKSFPVACFIHPTNVYLYCEVCEGMRKMKEQSKSQLLKDRKNYWWTQKIGQKTMFDTMGKKQFSQEVMFGVRVIMREPFSKSTVMNQKDFRSIEEHLDGSIQEIKPFKAVGEN